MSQNILAGKTGSVTIGSTLYSFGKWELEMHAKMVPVPNFLSGGFEQYVVGLIGGKITITGPYDEGNMAFSVGTQYSWILGLASAVSITVPGILESIKMAEDVEGSPIVTLSVQSNGTFTAAIT